MRAVPPWQVDVGDLRSEPGSTSAVEIVEPIDQVCVGSTCSRTDVPVELEAVLEPVTGGVDLSGTLRVAWTGQCRRCLEPVDGINRVDVGESFLVEHVDGESYPLVDDVVDLAEVARDMVALSLPLVPLCGVECVGPQPERFPVQLEDEEPAERPLDPRWAALDALRAPDDVER